MHLISLTRPLRRWTKRQETLTQKHAIARQFYVCQIVWSSFKGYLVFVERNQNTSHIFSHMTYDPKMWPWRRRKIHVCDKSFALCVNIVNIYVKFRGIQKRFNTLIIDYCYIYMLWRVSREWTRRHVRYVTWDSYKWSPVVMCWFY